MFFSSAKRDSAVGFLTLLLAILNCLHRCSLACVKLVNTIFLPTSGASSFFPPSEVAIFFSLGVAIFFFSPSGVSSVMAPRVKREFLRIASASLGSSVRKTDIPAWLRSPNWINLDLPWHETLKKNCREAANVYMV